jgi:hypothetical protein
MAGHPLGPLVSGRYTLPLTSGPEGGGGWPGSQTPWPADPTLQPLAGWLHGDTLQEAVIGDPKPKVRGGQTPWLPGHVPRLASHNLESYQLNQVGNPSLEPYKCPLPVEINTPHSTCSSPLVKVLV